MRPLVLAREAVAVAAELAPIARFRVMFAMRPFRSCETELKEAA